MTPEIAQLAAVLAAFGAAIIGIFAFVDRRTQMAKADLLVELNEIKARVSKLEQSQTEARTLIIEAIELAPPEAETLREKLRNAVKALH